MSDDLTDRLRRDARDLRDESVSRAPMASRQDEAADEIDRLRKVVTSLQGELSLHREM